MGQVSPAVYRARRRFAAAVGATALGMVVLGTTSVVHAIGSDDAAAAPRTQVPVDRAAPVDHAAPAGDPTAVPTPSAAGRPAVDPSVAVPARSAPARTTASRAATPSAPASARVATPGALPVDPATGIRARPDDPGLPASGSGRRVVYSISHQRVWLVDARDRVVRTYRVSGARHEYIHPRTYHVYSASRHAIAWDHKSTMQWMVRFAKGSETNIGFHDLPREDADGRLAQTTAQLGMPLSDGCIRQAPQDAHALFDFAPVGTAVVVTA